MQTLWVRAAQARTSCRCPSCSFTHRSVPRRRTAASIAQNICSSTTGFAVSFSTAVASASYLDARSKQNQRRELNQSLAELQAEVQAIVENQEARIHALEEKLGRRLPQIRAQEKEASVPPVLYQQHGMLQRPYALLGRTHASSAGLKRQGGPNVKEALSGDYQNRYSTILDECKDILEARMATKRVQSTAHDHESVHTAIKNSKAHRDAWKSQPEAIPSPRKALTLMLHMSRLIHQFDLLQLYLTSQMKNHPKNDPATSQRAKFAIQARNICSLQSLDRLDLMAFHLQESFRKNPHLESLDELAEDIYQELASQKDIKLRYEWLRSPAKQLAAVQKQEEELSHLLQIRCNPSKLLKYLSEFLQGNEFAPSIHMLNTMIIRLCDRGLPCAARLVLECLRKSPLEANDVTDAAAIRCAFLDRDENLFHAYYGNMKGDNHLGWHHFPSTLRGATWQVRQSGESALSFTPASQNLAAVNPTSQEVDEVVIRHYLRQRRVTLALKEYRRFLRNGGLPSLRLMESFLKACHSVGDEDMAWPIWQQLCLVHEKPSSAAYYWMLHLLSRSTHSYARVSETVLESRATRFQQVAEELARHYNVNQTLSLEDFRAVRRATLGVNQLTDQIEDLSVRQWVPHMYDAPPSLPDILDDPSRRAWPRNLIDYLAQQHEMLGQHLEFKGEVHTSAMMQSFLQSISSPASSLDPLNYARAFSTPPAEMKIQWSRERGQVATTGAKLDAERGVDGLQDEAEEVVETQRQDSEKMPEEMPEKMAEYITEGETQPQPLPVPLSAPRIRRIRPSRPPCIAAAEGLGKNEIQPAERLIRRIRSHGAEDWRGGSLESAAVA